MMMMMMLLLRRSRRRINHNIHIWCTFAITAHLSQQQILHQSSNLTTVKLFRLFVISRSLLLLFWYCWNEELHKCLSYEITCISIEDMHHILLHNCSSSRRRRMMRIQQIIYQNSNPTTVKLFHMFVTSRSLLLLFWYCWNEELHDCIN